MLARRAPQWAIGTHVGVDKAVELQRSPSIRVCELDARSTEVVCIQPVVAVTQICLFAVHPSVNLMSGETVFTTQPSKMPGLMNTILTALA